MTASLGSLPRMDWQWRRRRARTHQPYAHALAVATLRRAARGGAELVTLEQLSTDAHKRAIADKRSGKRTNVR